MGIPAGHIETACDEIPRASASLLTDPNSVTANSLSMPLKVNVLTLRVNTLTSTQGKFAYMKTLAQKISEARIEAGYKTQSELAKAVGVQRPTVTQWESGSTKMVSGDRLTKLCKVLNLSAEWLIHDRGPKHPPARVSEPLHAYEVALDDGGDGFDSAQEAWVEDVEVSVSAGRGKLLPEFVSTKYKQRYRLSWFREKRVSPEHVRTMRVTGDSMERTLFDGDKIAVDFSAVNLLNGKVYVVAIGEEVRVKRLFRMADGRVRIASDNQDKIEYPDEFISVEESDSFAVLGRVIDRSGDGGL